MLFSWTPARVVWLSYEVVMFKSRLGTATSLVSVAIVTSYLKTPFYRLAVFCICPLQPSCPNYPSHLPHWYWAALLFAPDLSSSFRSWNACPNKRPFPPAFTACLSLAVFTPSTCSPGTFRPLQPLSVIPFLPHNLSYGRRPFYALNVTSYPFKSLVLSLICYVLPPTFI